MEIQQTKRKGLNSGGTKSSLCMCCFKNRINYCILCVRVLVFQNSLFCHCSFASCIPIKSLCYLFSMAVTLTITKTNFYFLFMDPLIFGAGEHNAVIVPAQLNTSVFVCPFFSLLYNVKIKMMQFVHFL